MTSLVLNSCGTAAGSGGPTAPVVTSNPVNQTVTAGRVATFTATASGSPAPTVQWQASTDGGVTFNNLSGDTSTTLLFGTTAAQNGNQFRAVFNNAEGSATSGAALLTVNSAPSITTTPLSQTILAGNPVTFTAAASGSPAPTVQWQVSTDSGATFNNLSGATSTSLTFTTTTALNGLLPHRPLPRP